MATQDDWFAAIKSGNVAMVSRLVDRYAGVRDQLGETGLMCAVRSDQVRVAEILLPHERGQLNNRRETALLIAIQLHNQPLVGLLAPAESGVMLEVGCSVLHYAVVYEFNDSVPTLVKYLKHTPDLDGLLPLDLAVRSNNFDAAGDILYYGQPHTRASLERALSFAQSDVAARWERLFVNFFSIAESGQPEDLATVNRAEREMEIRKQAAQAAMAQTLTTLHAPVGGGMVAGPGTTNRFLPHGEPAVIKDIPPEIDTTTENTRDPHSPSILHPEPSVRGEPDRSTAPLTTPTHRFLQSDLLNTSTVLPLASSLVIGRTATPSTRMTPLTTIAGRKPASVAPPAPQPAPPVIGKAMAATRSNSSSRAITASGHAADRPTSSLLTYGRAVTPSDRDEKDKESVRYGIFERDIVDVTAGVTTRRTAQDVLTLLGSNRTGVAIGDTARYTPDISVTQRCVSGRPTSRSTRTSSRGTRQSSTSTRIMGVERAGSRTAGSRTAENMIKNLVTGKYFNGDTELIYAVKHKNLPMVQQLASIQSSQRDADGKTALILAAERQNLAMIEVLAPFEAGQRDGAGATALMYLAENGYVEGARLLVPQETGAQRETDGYTALMIATDLGHMELVKLLVEYEAGKQAADGSTALINALRADNKDCAKVLYNFEKDICDEHGISGAVWAEQLNRTYVLKREEPPVSAAEHTSRSKSTTGRNEPGDRSRSRARRGIYAPTEASLRRSEQGQHKQTGRTAHGK